MTSRSLAYGSQRFDRTHCLHPHSSRVLRNYSNYLRRRTTIPAADKRLHLLGSNLRTRLPHSTLQQHLAQMRSIFQIRFQNQSWLAVTQHKNIRCNHAHSVPHPGRFIATASHILFPSKTFLFTPPSLHSKTTNAEKNSKEWWGRHKWKNRVGFAIRSFLFKTLKATLLCPLQQYIDHLKRPHELSKWYKSPTKWVNVSSLKENPPNSKQPRNKTNESSKRESWHFTLP